METNKLRFFTTHPCPSVDKSITINGMNELQERLLVTMATVVKVTKPWYFSCYEGPMAQLHVRFHEDRAVNKKKQCNQTDEAYIYD